MNQKFKYLIIGLSVLLVSVGIGFYLLNNSDSPKTTDTKNDVTTFIESSSADNQPKDNVSVDSTETNTSNEQPTSQDNTEKQDNAKKQDNTKDESQNSSQSYTWKGDFSLKNGEGKLNLSQEDSTSFKFTISGKNSGDYNVLNETTGIAKINDNTISSYTDTDGSIINFQNNDGSFLVTKYDNKNKITFEGVYLQE